MLLHLYFFLSTVQNWPLGVPSFFVLGSFIFFLRIPNCTLSLSPCQNIQLCHTLKRDENFATGDKTIIINVLTQIQQLLLGRNDLTTQPLGENILSVHPHTWEVVAETIFLLLLSFLFFSSRSSMPSLRPRTKVHCFLHFLNVIFVHN